MNGYGVLAEWCCQEKTEVLEGKHVSVPLCPPKFHIKWPRNEPRRPWWKTSDCLRYGMAKNHYQPFLHIKLGWRSVGKYTFWLLYLYIKRPLVLTWGEDVRAPQPLWTLMRGEKFLVPAKNWRPACVLVTLPTELSWRTLPCTSYIDKHPTFTVAACLYGNI